LLSKDTVFFRNDDFCAFLNHKWGHFVQKHSKIGCKTCFCVCLIEKIPLSLQALTKQHNLFYTLKKLIPINSAGLCEKSRAVVLYIQERGLYQVRVRFGKLVLSFAKKTTGFKYCTFFST
jgi:hypothetical protein